MKKLSSLFAVLASALVLTACGGGGGGDDTARAASADATLSVNPSNGAAVTSSLVGENFTFPAGVPELGTTGAATTVAFTPRGGAAADPTIPAANPAFSISSGGSTATGVMDFGSCKFKIQSTTFTSGPLSTVGTIITVAQCQVFLDIGGTPADGTAYERSVSLTLGTAVSQNVTVTVSINSGGQIVVNGKAEVGVVVIAPVTGA